MLLSSCSNDSNNSDGSGGGGHSGVRKESEKHHQEEQRTHSCQCHPKTTQLRQHEQSSGGGETEAACM